METDRDQGTLAKAPATLTVNAYLDQWLETAKRPKLRPKTYQDYQQLVRLYVQPKLGTKKLSALTPLDLQRAYNDMQAAGLSARTIQLTHAVLRGALNQAVKWGYLARNPASGVELPTQQRKEMQALHPDQIEQFQRVAQDLDADGATLFEFMMATGVRPSEALGLQWGDLDWGTGRVTVQRSLSWTRDSQWGFEGPKTPKSRRTIPLPAPLVAALAEHKRRQTERRLRAGPNWQGLDLVFCTRTGGPRRPRNVVVQFKRLLRAAELPESVRLYDTRHTTATLLMASGLNPKVVAERLGHASVKMTLDVYSHVSEGMQQEATAVLEALLYRRPPQDAQG